MAIEVFNRYEHKYLLDKDTYEKVIEIMDKHTRIKTTDLGSLFELCYNVTMKENQNEQEFLNEIRCRNGNLNIILALAVPIQIK